MLNIQHHLSPLYPNSQSYSLSRKSSSGRQWTSLTHCNRISFVSVNSLMDALALKQDQSQGMIWLGKDLRDHLVPWQGYHSPAQGSALVYFMTVVSKVCSRKTQVKLVIRAVVKEHDWNIFLYVEWFAGVLFFFSKCSADCSRRAGTDQRASCGCWGSGGMKTSALKTKQGHESVLLGSLPLSYNYTMWGTGYFVFLLVKALRSFSCAHLGNWGLFPCGLQNCRKTVFSTFLLCSYMTYCSLKGWKC